VGAHTHPTPPRTRRLLASLTPEWVLAGATLVVAALTALVAVDITAVAFDETFHKQSAVRYSNGLMNLFDDPSARATSRLYPLLLAPLVQVLDGDDAVRAARVLGALLLCSAAWPAFLLATRVLASRWACAGAAFLAIATPWLALGTTLYTEVLAYPVALWAVWGVVRALEAPSPRRDLVAMALLGVALTTRVQLAALVAGYWIVIAVFERARWRRFPFAAAALVLAVPALLVGLLGGAIGGYDSALERVPRDLALGGLIEVVNLGVGMGIVAGAIGAAWYWGAWGRRDRFAGVTGILLGVLLLVTLVAQGGFLAQGTEERYFVYAVPYLWIGAFAAVLGRETGRTAVLVALGLVAVTYGALAPLTVAEGERWFLGPAASAAGDLFDRTLGRWGAPTLRDTLFLAAAAGLVALAIVWNRRPRARLVVALAIPAAVQLVVGGWALAANAGVLPGKTGSRTEPVPLFDGWIDRADAPGATWVQNQPAGAQAELQQRVTLFANSAIWNRTSPVPGLPPVAVPLDSLPPIPPQEIGTRPIVQSAASPLLQYAGRRLASSPGDELELVRPAAGLPTRWSQTGLAADGYVLFGPGAQFEARAPGAPLVALTVTVAGNPTGPTRMRLAAGGRTAEATVPPTGDATLRLVACATNGTVRGRLSSPQTAVLPDGRGAGSRVTSVRVAARMSATSGGPARCPHR
jgi:hypothetical protein